MTCGSSWQQRTGVSTHCSEAVVWLNLTCLGFQSSCSTKWTESRHESHCSLVAFTSQSKLGQITLAAVVDRYYVRVLYDSRVGQRRLLAKKLAYVLQCAAGPAFQLLCPMSCREVLRLTSELDSQQMRACVLLETLETLQVRGYTLGRGDAIGGVIYPYAWLVGSRKILACQSGCPCVKRGWGRKSWQGTPQCLCRDYYYVMQYLAVSAPAFLSPYAA